jgi:hypothetical protein
MRVRSIKWKLGKGPQHRGKIKRYLRAKGAFVTPIGGSKMGPARKWVISWP